MYTHDLYTRNGVVQYEPGQTRYEHARLQQDQNDVVQHVDARVDQVGIHSGPSRSVSMITNWSVNVVTTGMNVDSWRGCRTSVGSTFSKR